MPTPIFIPGLTWNAYTSGNLAKAAYDELGYAFVLVVNAANHVAYAVINGELSRSAESIPEGV